MILPKEPGEWKTDKSGRRYRENNNCREYEPTINGIPESVFYASQKRQRELDAKARERERKEAAERAAQRRNCPFKEAMNTDCDREACALFLNGCALAKHKPAKDTKGLKCPFDKFQRKCRADCALYKGGCTFTGTIKEESEAYKYEQI